MPPKLWSGKEPAAPAKSRGRSSSRSSVRIAEPEPAETQPELDKADAPAVDEPEQQT